MKKKDQKRMWNLDHKSQLGQSLTDEEKEFFTSNYLKMLETLESKYNHWFYHSIKVL
jgi:hypothetical protein